MATTRSEGRVARLLVLALLPAVVACANLMPGGTAPGETTESVRSAYRAALAAAERNPREGLQQLDAFLAAHPRSALADDAGLRRADLLIRLGDEAAATEQLRWILRRHPRADRSDLARLRLAVLLRGGDAREAYRFASEVRVEGLPPADRPKALRLLAELAMEAGDPVGQLQWLAKLRGQGDEAAAAVVDAEIDTLIAHLDAGELERAAEQLERAYPAARVRLREAELALGRHDGEAAEAALARAAALPLTRGEAERLAVLEARLHAGVGGPGLLRRIPGPGELPTAIVPDPARLRGTLGVALPLSGPYAAFGEESLRGVLLATGLFDPEGPRASGLRLLVRDTRGTAEGAAQAVRELAENRDLLAIVGPLLGEEAAGAAPVAQRAGVPLLTLTGREEVAFDHPYVFRLGLTPALEVQLLVDYALAELRVRRFAILHPKDDYGRHLRNLFWDAVELSGGEVVGVAGYEAEATDFAAPIRSLVGFQLLSSGQQAALSRRKKLLDQAKRSGRETAAELRSQASQLRGPGDAPLPPFVDFDALFIPDAHDKVVLIAPQLAFHEVRGIRLLGPSGWNHPDLVTIAGRHVEGAVFTGSFFRGSGRSALTDFNRRFEATFGHPVESFAAEAYDATSLLLLQLDRRRDSRSALREGLLKARLLSGVSGVSSVRPDGNVDKRAHLLGVHRGEIISIDERGEPPRLRASPARAGN